MIALRGIHIGEMDSNSSVAAMPYDCMHTKLSAEFAFFDSKMNLDFRSDRILLFAQNANADGTHIGQEACREFARRPEQDAPVRRPPRVGSSFGSVVVGQGLASSLEPKPPIGQATVQTHC